MSENVDKLKNFQNDAKFLRDYIESLARGDVLEVEFPDMVMVLGFLTTKMIEGQVCEKEVLLKARFKDFRKQVPLIKWDSTQYSQVMFNEDTGGVLDRALNTTTMRAAYRVTSALYPIFIMSDQESWDFRAWQIYHLVSGRPLYAGAQADISWMYFQARTPDLKPKQILGKKVFDGIFKAGLSTSFELILVMLVCWHFEKKKKQANTSLGQGKIISITHGNIEGFSIAVKSFVAGWTEMAMKLFNSPSIEDLFTPYLIFDFRTMDLKVLREGFFASKCHKWTVFTDLAPVGRSHCEYDIVKKRTTSENKRLRSIASAFFVSFWKGMESLRTVATNFDSFKELHGPVKKPCPLKGLIPNSVWSILEELSAVKRHSSLKPPEGMPTFSLLPKHIIRHFVVFYQCWNWEERLGSLSLDEWPVHFQQQFAQMPPFSLLSVDEMQYNVRVGPSTIPNSGLGVFAKVDLQKGTVIGWYNGTIVYHDLEVGETRDDVYGSTLFGCTADQFKKYAIEVNSSGIFLVAPEYCIAGKVNDPRCLGRVEGDSKKEPNCIFEGKVCAINNTNLKDPFLVTLQTSEDIPAGEELFVDYGEKYANWS